MDQVNDRESAYEDWQKPHRKLAVLQTLVL